MFYTPPHDSGRVLWFHVGRPYVCPSVSRTSVHPSICFSFPDEDLSKHHWIFTKLGMCIDIMEIWFGIDNGKFHQIFKELSARDTIMAGYYSLKFLFCFCFFIVVFSFLFKV